MKDQKKFGVSLSGGGYRATAFHLGTLRKLDELKLLDKVDVMSTISGGSITGACYCINDENFEAFEKKLRTAVNTKSVIKEILLSLTFFKAAILVLLFLVASVVILFTKLPWLSPIIIILLIIILVRYQFSIFPVSKEIEKAYNKFFYDNKTLKDLNDKPLLAIGSTNLQTSRPFTFSRSRMSDSSYDYMEDGAIHFNAAEFPIARAVMASSCVPFAFTPVTIDKAFYKNPGDSTKVPPQLVDGGVYDNQGIHKITQKESMYECDIIITSDAGNKLPFTKLYNNTLVLLIRTVDVFMDRIKKFQMVQNIYKNTEKANKQIAYLSLGWDLDECIPGFIANMKNKLVTGSVIEAHHIPPGWEADTDKYKNEINSLLEKNTGYELIKKRDINEGELKIARSVGTNLTKLSVIQIDCLVKQAENLTELQVKLYCPDLFKS